MCLIFSVWSLAEPGLLPAWVMSVIGYSAVAVLLVTYAWHLEMRRPRSAKFPVASLVRVALGVAYFFSLQQVDSIDVGAVCSCFCYSAAALVVFTDYRARAKHGAAPSKP